MTITRSANVELAGFNTFDTAFWTRGGDSWLSAQLTAVYLQLDGCSGVICVEGDMKLVFAVTGSFDLNNNVLYLSPNLVFLNASSNGQPSGVVFFVRNYTGSNVPSPTDVAVALFFGTSVPSMEYAADTGNTGFGCCSLETAGTFTVSEVGATPLPAALPLFATGIGGLALLGWRRKRKARAVA